MQASVSTDGRRRSYTITPESLADAYKRHLPDLLKRGIPNQSLFEAYVQYVHSPKHTVGEQLLDVRRDKRERAAYAATRECDLRQESPEEDDENDNNEEGYRIGFSEDSGFQEA